MIRENEEEVGEDDDEKTNSTDYNRCIKFSVKLQ